MTRGGIESGDRDLLDLERHDVAVRGQISGGVGIVETCGDKAIDDGARRAIGIGIERVHVVAKGARCDRRHAAELSATKDAYGGAGEDRCRHQSP